MKKIIDKIFKWLFSEQISELNQKIDDVKSLQKRLERVIGSADVTVDYSHYSQSWAVISIHGEDTTLIRFFDLDNHSIKHIANFLSQFDRGRVKVDVPFSEREFLKVKAKNL